MNNEGISCIRDEKMLANFALLKSVRIYSLEDLFQTTYSVYAYYIN